MKKVLMMLCAILALASCKKEAFTPEPQTNISQTKEKRSSTINISGELANSRALSYLNTFTIVDDGTNKKLTSSNQNKTIQAHYFIYNGSGQFIYDTIDLLFDETGKKFRASKICPDLRFLGPVIYIDLYVGFDDHLNFIGSSDLVRYRAGEQVNMNMAFKSVANPLTYDSQKEVFYNFSSNLKLIGALVRCKFENQAGKDYLITGINTHSFGLNEFKVKQPEYHSWGGRPYDTSPKLTANSRGIQTIKAPNNTPMEIRAGEEYLMYLPNVLVTMPSKSSHMGAIALETKPKDGVYDRAVYTDLALMNQTTDGTMVSATLTLRKQEIPLNYFTEEAVGLTPTTKVAPVFTMNSFANGATPTMNYGYYKGDEIPSIRIEGYHVPEKDELAEILPTEGTILYKPTSVHDRAANLSSLTLDKEIINKGSYIAKVGREYFFGAKSFFRGALPYRTRNTMVEQNDFFRGVNTGDRAIYEIHNDNSIYGNNNPAIYEFESIKNFTSHEKLICILNNNARLAYRFTYLNDRLIVETRPIGGDPSIVTPKDLRDKGYFNPGSPNITRKEIRYLGGTSQRPHGLRYVASNEVILSDGTPIANRYPDSYLTVVDRGLIGGLATPYIMYYRPTGKVYADEEDPYSTHRRYEGSYDPSQPVTNVYAPIYLFRNPQ